MGQRPRLGVHLEVERGAEVPGNRGLVLEAAPAVVGDVEVAVDQRAFEDQLEDDAVLQQLGFQLVVEIAREQVGFGIPHRVWEQVAAHLEEAFGVLEARDVRGSALVSGRWCYLGTSVAIDDVRNDNEPDVGTALLGADVRADRVGEQQHRGTNRVGAIVLFDAMIDVAALDR